MPDNSTRLINNTTHASNDSSLEVITSDQKKGNGFYGSTDGLHTVQYSVAEFSGDIILQAAIAVDPSEKDWFTVIADTVGNDTTNRIFNFTGNYVWIRAVVKYTSGTVNSIMLNY